MLIRGATVVTCNGAFEVIANGEVWIKGDTIAGVGPAGSFSAQGQEVLDASGKVALPGLVNAHLHGPMTLLRGVAPDTTVAEWFRRIWTIESGLTPADVRAGARLAVLEMIDSGTTAFADHYFHMDEVAEAALAGGLRALLAWAVFGVGNKAQEHLERSLDFAERWRSAAGGRIRSCLGPHSPYACPLDFLHQVAELAQERQLGLHIHLAETAKQLAESQAQYRRTPTQVLADTGILGPRTIVAHAIHLSDGDIALLAESGTSTVYCPEVHHKLALGTKRVSDLLAAGVNVALGTDGPASNDDLNLWGELRLAALAQKQASSDPERLNVQEVLRLATTGGARALGFAGGQLARGLVADVIFIDFRRPHLVPAHDVVSNLVYAARASDVSDVIVAGQFVKRAGQVLTLDAQEVMADAQQRAARLVIKRGPAIMDYRKV